MKKLKKYYEYFEHSDLTMKITIIAFIIILLLGVVEGIYLLSNFMQRNNDSSIENVKYENNRLNNSQMNNSNNSVAQPNTNNINNTSNSSTQITNIPTIIEFEDATSKPSKDMHNVVIDIQKKYTGLINVKIISISDWETVDKYKVERCPTQIFINAEGKEIQRHVGALSLEELETRLKNAGMIK